MKNKYLVITIFILLSLIVGFILINRVLNKSIKPDETKLQVTTSFYPLYFFASQIAGTKAEVINITPSGTEPHDYDLTTRDVARITNGDLLILNGGVEAWADKLKDNLSSTNLKIITAGEGLLSKETEENGVIIRDPHIWLSPRIAKMEVQKITQGFIELDPINKSYFENNQELLNGKLDALNLMYKTGLKNCISRDVITSHAAFSYLTEEYGLKQVSISGISPDEEPSAKQLAEVATFAKENNVKYIFFESLLSPKLSQTIADEIGAETLVLDPIEGISDDGLSKGKNYFTVMEDNLKNLERALQCST